MNKNTFWKKLKSSFFTGLLAVFPIWATLFILLTVFKIIASIARPYLRNIPALADIPILLDLVSFLGTVSFVVILGLLLRNVVGKRIFQWFDRTMEQIPLLSWIYSSIRKVTSILSSEGDTASQFKHVVMFEYVRKGIFALGFVTSDSRLEFSQKSGEQLVNVFLPTTPNPTSGFLLMIPRKDLTPVDISTEDAIKLVVSAGIANS